MIGNMQMGVRAGALIIQKERMQERQKYVIDVCDALQSAKDEKEVYVGNMSLQKYLAKMHTTDVDDAHYYGVPKFEAILTIPNVIENCNLELGINKQEAEQLANKLNKYTFIQTPNSRDAFFKTYKSILGAQESHIPYLGLFNVFQELNAVIDDDNLRQCEVVEEIALNKKNLTKILRINNYGKFEESDWLYRTARKLNLGINLLKCLTSDQLRKEKDEEITIAKSYRKQSKKMLNKISQNLEQLGHEYRNQYFERFN